MGAVTSETTAALLAEYLSAAGVRHVFGYPGESVIDFMEACRRGGVGFVSAVREGSAAFMAEAAAMCTGLPGVCLSTLGPGSTALLNGVASATLDRAPVLAIGSLNRIELKQQTMGYPSEGTRVAATDLAAQAQAMGCDGVRVDTVSGLEKALGDLGADGTRTRPLVVEARIDTHQYEVQF